jgi:ribosomal protein S16
VRSAWKRFRRQTSVVIVLEFWPDYGPGPLWTGDGKAADLAGLPIDGDLVERLTTWNAAYSEDKVPLDGPGDLGWLGQGKRLLDEVRAALHDQHRIVVREPWWGEKPI